MSTALITGASKGIGKAIATELAAKGYPLILVARSEKLLTELAEELQKKYRVEVSVLPLDLTGENAVESILDFIRKKNLAVSVLVNNAGYGLWGNFSDVNENEISAMMRINMFTPVRLTHAMLPVLRKEKQSYILNIASTSAYQALPTMAVYAASKSFMLLFSRALRFELNGSNVSVTCLSPGPTETNFMNQAKMLHPDIIKRAAKFNMKPEIVGKFAVNGMFRKKNEIIPGWINRVSVMLTYFAPKKLTEKIAAGFYKT